MQKNDVQNTNDAAINVLSNFTRGRDSLQISVCHA